MRKASLVVFGIAAAMLAGGAAAQEAAPQRLVVPSSDPQWVRVSGDEEVIGYVDRRSIRNGNGQVTFVGRIEYAQPDEDGIKMLVHSGVLDCAARTYRIVAFDALDSSGNLIASHRAEDPAAPINEGSPNAALVQEFCR